MSEIRDEIRDKIAHIIEERLEDDIDLDLNDLEDTVRFHALVASLTDAVHETFDVVDGEVFGVAPQELIDRLDDSYLHTDPVFMDMETRKLIREAKNALISVNGELRTSEKYRRTYEHRAARRSKLLNSYYDERESLKEQLTTKISEEDRPLWRRITNQRRELRALNKWNALLDKWYGEIQTANTELKAEIEKLKVIDDEHNRPS